MVETALRATALSIRATQGPDFRDLDFEVSKGEAVALTSIDSADLPTLIEVLAGLKRPQEGEVSRGDLVLSAKSRHTRLRLRDFRTDRQLRLTGGLISPATPLINNLSLYENIALPLRYHLAPKAEVVASRTNRLLKVLKLTGEASQKPADLPRGVLVRAQLARALILDPTVIFLGSRLSDLDGESAALIISALKDLIEKDKLTVIAVSYAPLTLLPLVSRVLVLYAGRLGGTLEGARLENDVFLENLTLLGRSLQQKD